jgi:hypothetical protein
MAAHALRMLQHAQSGFTFLAWICSYAELSIPRPPEVGCENKRHSEFKNGI